MIGIATMKYKISIFEITKILGMVIVASLAFGSAFQKINANCKEIKTLHSYYIDISTSLNKIAVDTAEIKGQLNGIARVVYK